ncbi:NADP-dependent oxidoreductase [Rhodococcus sp. 077-4]|uniref:NADP-dependent oxidoreductase n=1 Tax=Rhodococcus sp. 077-4 TaxID=2789271 RepID=UPI0039F4C099
MIAYGFIEYGGPDTQAFLDLPVAEPGPGQILVAVHAAGVNPADWKVRAGNRKSTVHITLPAVLGREVAGTVVRVGSGVDGFSTGDAVFGATASGHGGYAQYTLLDAAGAAPKPETVSWAVAATLPVAAGTAYDALHGLSVVAGNTVLVLGAGGGVGSSVLQLARAESIDVLAVASAGKREWIESLGAEFVASGPDYVDSISRSVDGIVDLVGGDTLRAAAEKTGAPIVSVADPLLAAQWGGSGAERDRTTAAFTRLAELVSSGVLRPRIEHVFPLERAGEALALVENGHVLGKVVVEVR